ncbi:PD-(D/E)XK nuclease family transposase [Sarcina ventriculi]|uniref:Rpn family recombination-promoting nuclease/putative transposase n=1 Tax=Sarcina ventriculi TaxID=1267 RepID=UPI000D876857|nr:Rpn family recombination-promoting nuclease/putative transposase [Sarcina ventriculi]MBU5323639.1 Rpn family recombination-promoting nuclease/putative transposase [Sarcina ventriculi]SPZ51154.1 PD-(D/E)XK nuclease family transposase [Sarcina ventriculi]
MVKLLDPKMDFIFKNIFGSENNKEILISFLNATLKSEDKIKSVFIKNGDIEKEHLTDKFSRLDIKAITDKNEHINIEIQMKNEYNMIQRTLYYWAKLYEGQLKEGDNYSKLSRTICINILNFSYLNNDKFHSAFRLKDIETNDELTDIQEIHFIEVPKLKDNSDEKDMLVAWTEFLKDPESEKVRTLEMSIEEIRKARQELVKISSDDRQRELYNMRRKAMLDESDALYNAEQKGKLVGLKEGEQKGKIEMIKGLLLSNVDIEIIKTTSGLTIDEINNIKKLL